MGVDFFPCDVCGVSICDCGYYIHCRDICERTWCSKRCAEKDGFQKEIEDAEDPNDYSCRFCRGEDAEDSELLEFLIEKYKLTRDNVLKMYLEWVK
jgi:hypothetical protein